MLLAGAGLVKLATDGVPGASAVTSLLLPDWALAVVPAYEIALGGWLVSLRWRFGAWLTAVFTLAVFCLHNLELVAAAVPSCGCLGAVGPAPGVMLALDIGALAVLLKRRPGWHGWPARGPGLTLAATATGVLALTLGTAAVGVYAAYGSVAVALADVRGDAVAVVPGTIDLGVVAPDAAVEHVVRLHNLTADPVEVTAARVNCNCARVTGLPLTLAPGGRGEATWTVRLPARAGQISLAGVFETSVGEIPVPIRGTVRVRLVAVSGPIE